MPVEGDSKAATQLRAGSNRRACVRPQPFQILDPVAASRGGDLLETGYLRLAGRHNQLAQPGMRDPVLAAIAVEPMAPFYTAARLQAAEGVIEPAMDDFAVARRSLEPDRVGLLENEHLDACQCERPSHRQADDAGSDHDALNLVHQLSVTSLSVPSTNKEPGLD